MKKNFFIYLLALTNMFVMLSCSKSKDGSTTKNELDDKKIEQKI